MTISLSEEDAIASIAASLVSVGASSSRVRASMRAMSSATLPTPITTARSTSKVERDVLEVGMAVVPGDELGGRPRSRQILAGDAEPPVGLRADRVDDGVVETREVFGVKVAADLDVPEEAEAGLVGDLLERTRDGLELRMVWRDAEPHESPRRREALDHVHLDRRVGAQQRARGVEACRTGTDDRNAHAAMLIQWEQPEPQPAAPSVGRLAVGNVKEWPQPHDAAAFGFSILNPDS